MSVEIDDVLAFDRHWRGITEGESHPPTFILELVDLYNAGQLPVDEITRRYKPEQWSELAADMHSGRTIKPVIVWR